MNGIKINGVNYDWGDVIITNTMSGLDITCTGVEYKKSQEKELIYGLGNEPIGTGNGLVKYEGSISMNKSGLDMLNTLAKAFGAKDILGIPGAAMNIIVSYMNGYILKVDTLIGVCFTEVPRASKKGDKEFEVSLPFIYLREESI